MDPFGVAEQGVDFLFDTRAQGLALELPQHELDVRFEQGFGGGVFLLGQWMVFRALGDSGADTLAHPAGLAMAVRQASAALWQMPAGMDP